MVSGLPLILICDDDATFHLAVKHAVKGRLECRSAYHGDEALAIVRNQPVDLVLLDIQMRTPDEGLRYIEKLRELDPDLAIVMSSGLTDFQSVREAMRLGATDYVPKDFEVEELLLTIDRTLERRRLILRRSQLDYEAQAHQRKHAMVGESAAILEIRRTIEKIRSSRASVVITGETGTGKEVVARQLRSSLPDGTLAPFVAVDSSTIQSSIAESLLFGHEKGSFTGAERTTKGVFEEADGGIVYFDEIGNMATDIQSKLLRVIQEREVRKLGSAKSLKLDFRVVCATNRDLEAMGREGSFKPDLFQRLNVLPIHLPALRDRVADLPALVTHLAAGVRRPAGPLLFSDTALETLRHYPWPGNVRELANLISYLGAMITSDEVEESDLPPKIRDSARIASRNIKTTAANPERSFYDHVAEFERSLLSDSFEKQGKNISRLAMTLGMDRSHLYSKLKEYGIHLPQKN